MTEVQVSDDDKRLQQIVEDAVGIAEPYHKAWRKKAVHFYELYRSYQGWRKAYESTAPRGKDAVYRDGQDEFGPELFIPLCFRTVETVLPRMLASRPKMGVKPESEESETNVKHVQVNLDGQQRQIEYQLKLQDIAKDGLTYGLGPAKTWWREDKRMIGGQITRAMGPLEPGQPEMVAAQPQLMTVFNDPDVAAIDPFDFLPDPFCGDIEDADFAIHRIWMTSREVLRRVQAGAWRNLEDVADLDAWTESRLFEEIWNERLKAGGNLLASSSQKGKTHLHEVLEFHDGEQVIVTLDRKVVVASGSNPLGWKMPFQCYRPTRVMHELYGIGEIEPIEQLQEEMNSLRTQRRYNADLVLQRVFAYNEGLVDANDIQYGPGYAIPVNGDPRELLFPIQTPDIPNSSYQEEDRIANDVDATSGVSDQAAGAEAAGSETATGAQIAMQAISARIQNKVLRLEREIIVPQARQFTELSQRKIFDVRERREELPEPMPGGAQNRWAWHRVGPAELMGEFSFYCEALSSMPENVPQDRSDAQMAMQMLEGNQMVDQTRLVLYVIRKLGLEDPESWLAPPDPKVPPEALDEILRSLVTVGMDPEQAREIIAEALARAGGPDLGSGAESPPEAGANPEESEASPNGSAPEPERTAS